MLDGVAIFSLLRLAGKSIHKPPCETDPRCDSVEYSPKDIVSIYERQVYSPSAIVVC